MKMRKILALSLSAMMLGSMGMATGCGPERAGISKDAGTINVAWTVAGYGEGYIREVAEAFNKNNSILKALYSLKERALQAGQSDASRTACTGVDNRNICGYGSGYSIIPYFEGGVGVSCFWSILEKCGFKCSAHYGKNETFYSVHKMEV